MYHAFASRGFSAKKNLEEARKSMDRALAISNDPPSYLVARDAQLMMQEDRHEDAWDRLHGCLASLPAELDEDQFYVSLLCRLWLAAYDYRTGYENLATLAEQANSARRDASVAATWVLPFLSEKVLKRIFGKRVEITSFYSFVAGPSPTPRLRYSSDFDGH